MRHKELSRTLIATVLMVLGIVACDDDTEENMSEVADNDDLLADALQVQLSRWTDVIEVSYTFTNTTATDVVVFDASQTGQDVASAELLDDGTVRLFRGKYALFGVTPVTAPLIDGRLVVPGGSVQGTGMRDFPITVPPASDDQTTSVVSPSSFEFCVGFSRAEDVLGQMVGNGSYELEADLDLQRFACQVISSPDQ